MVKRVAFQTHMCQQITHFSVPNLTAAALAKCGGPSKVMRDKERMAQHVQCFRLCHDVQSKGKAILSTLSVMMQHCRGVARSKFTRLTLAKH